MRTKKLIATTLEATKLPGVHISVMQEDTIKCLDSKFGGIPYLPKGEKIPTCPEGEEMQFIAQINFAQAPKLKGFPSDGILQFFVDIDMERFFDKIEDETAMRELYSVRYYPHPDETLQQDIAKQHFTVSQSITEVIEGDKRMLWEEYQTGEKAQKREESVSVIMSMMERKMAFQSAEEIATLSFSMELETDFGYESAWEKIPPTLIKKSGYDIENWEDDTNDFCWDFGNWGCKIGGHPSVRQKDIRYDFEEYQEYTTLLFQYDLTTRKELEQDTFAFLIKPEDLKACEFDDVLLYWHNCY